MAMPRIKIDSGAATGIPPVPGAAGVTTPPPLPTTPSAGATPQPRPGTLPEDYADTVAITLPAPTVTVVPVPGPTTVVHVPAGTGAATPPPLPVIPPPFPATPPPPGSAATPPPLPAPVSTPFVAPAAPPPAPPAPSMVATVAAVEPTGVASAVVAASELFGKAVDKVERAVSSVVRGTGAAASGMAHNDPMPAFAGAVSAASSSLELLGPAGKVAGAAVSVFGEGVKAASAVVNSFVDRGRELSGFSGQLAGATAMADVKSLLADMREAEELGPSLAELIENQNKAELTFREIMLPIKKFLIDVLSGLLDSLVKVAVGILEGINDLLGNFRLRSDKIDDILRRITKIMEGDAGADGAKFLDAWLHAFPGGPALPRPAGFGGGPPGVPEFPRDAGLGVPLVGGP